MQEQLSESSPHFPWPWSPLQNTGCPFSLMNLQGRTRAPASRERPPPTQLHTLTPLTPSAEQKSKNNAACWNPKLRAELLPGFAPAALRGFCGRWFDGCCCLLFPTPTEACGVGTEVSAVWGTVCSWAALEKQSLLFWTSQTTSKRL